MKEEHRKKTEIIKLAAEIYANEGYSPVDMLLEAAIWLWELYKGTGDLRCIQAARQTVCAYAELGLPHEAAEKCCKEIWESLTSGEYAQIPQGYVPQRRLRRKISEIRTALGPWKRAKKQGMTAQEAAKDILEHLQEGKSGQWIYRQQQQEMIFELLILEEDAGSENRGETIQGGKGIACEAYLLDIGRRCIYTFEPLEKGGEHDDTGCSM